MKSQTNMNSFSRNRFNSEVDSWSSHNKYADIISWERHQRLKETLNLLEQYKGKKINILEVGCGAGNNLNVISKIDTNWSCTGVDISESMISYCKKTYTQKNISFDVLNIEDKKLTKKFDVIILLGVVGYFNNNEKAFNNITAMLSEKGKVLFTYGKKNSVFRKLRYLGVSILRSKLFLKVYNGIKKALWNEKPFDHASAVFNGYTPMQMRRILSSNSLQLLSTSHCCFAAGYFRRLSVLQSQFFELFLKNSDPLGLAMTTIIIARKK